MRAAARGTRLPAVITNVRDDTRENVEIGDVGDIMLSDFRDLLDQKRISVGGARTKSYERPNMQNSQARRMFLQRQRDKERARKGRKF